MMKEKKRKKPMNSVQFIIYLFEIMKKNPRNSKKKCLNKKKSLKKIELKTSDVKMYKKNEHHRVHA